MISIDSLISSLPDNAEDLKHCCSVGICADNMLTRLDQGLAYARKLTQDIEAISAHLLSLKARLSDEV